MINYNDYRAAVERLRRVESGEDLELIYHRHANEGCPLIRDDKCKVYDAEHDQTPATLEWLREIGQLVYVTPKMSHFIHLGGKKIWIDKDGRLVDGCPTCGDVLTALRLFGGKK